MTNGIHHFLLRKQTEEVKYNFINKLVENGVTINPISDINQYIEEKQYMKDITNTWNPYDHLDFKRFTDWNYFFSVHPEYSFTHMAENTSTIRQTAKDLLYKLFTEVIGKCTLEQIKDILIQSGCYYPCGCPKKKIMSP